MSLRCSRVDDFRLNSLAGNVLEALVQREQQAVQFSEPEFEPLLSIPEPMENVTFAKNSSRSPVIC
jgi:hypothetical protein